MPCLTLLLLLWVDEFNLKWALTLPAPPGGQALSARTGSKFSVASAVASAVAAPSGEPPGQASPQPTPASAPVASPAPPPADTEAPSPPPAAQVAPPDPAAAAPEVAPSDSAAALPEASQGPPPPTSTTAALAPTSSAAAEAPRLEHKNCVPLPEAPAKPVERPRGEARPRVGASIAVHPPKFYAVAKFLDQLANCPAAIPMLRVFLVFSSAQDEQLFRDALACLVPGLPPGVWEPVVALTPSGGWRTQGSGHQITAAYKKWHGIVHMMDLPKEEALEYGLMMDAELLLFDGRGEDQRGEDCQPGGAWGQLLDRIREAEASKSFPAARVSATLTTYNFGAWVQSGKNYDQALIRENLFFLGPDVTSCPSPGCQRLKEHVEKALYSWWTDLPWMNLTKAGQLLEWVSQAKGKFAGGADAWRPTPGWRPAQGWRALSVSVGFKRFEIMSYHQWCVLKEDFRFRDVTNITGEAKWGSYMEDPLPGARLGELKPLWVSSQAAERVENGKLPPLSRETPPFIIFHSDQGRSRAGREKRKVAWEEVLLALLKRAGRKDFSRDTIH